MGIKVCGNFIHAVPELPVKEEEQPDIHDILPRITKDFVLEVLQHYSIIPVAVDHITGQFENRDIIRSEGGEEAGNFPQRGLYDNDDTPAIEKMLIHFLDGNQPRPFRNLIEDMGTEDQVKAFITQVNICPTGCVDRECRVPAAENLCLFLVGFNDCCLFKLLGDRNSKMPSSSPDIQKPLPVRKPGNHFTDL
jgi:hypothetical protein